MSHTSNEMGLFTLNFYFFSMQSVWRAVGVMPTQNLLACGMKKSSPVSESNLDQVELLEVALHKLKQTAPHKLDGTSEQTVIRRELEVIDGADKLHKLHKEHDRITRLIKEHEPKEEEEVTSEKRKDVTSDGEVLIEDGLENSESEVQTVKRKDDKIKKSECSIACFLLEWRVTKDFCVATKQHDA